MIADQDLNHRTPIHKRKPEFSMLALTGCVSFSYTSHAAASLQSVPSSSSCLQTSERLLGPLFPPSNRSRFDSAKDDILVSHEHKLFVCYILKNAATEWIKLAFNLSQRVYDDDYWYHRTLHTQTLEPMGRNISSLSSVCSEDWARLVTLREPHERLLSAYLDKCLASRETPCLNAMDLRLPVPAFVDWVRLLTPAQVLYASNHHFMLQSEFCGINAGLMSSFYTTVLDMSDSKHFAPRVRRILSAHGLTNSTMDEFFPLERHDADDPHVSSAGTKLCSYYDRATWNIVTQLYQVDVEMYESLFGAERTSFESMCSSTPNNQTREESH